ncbi:putative membrane protein [Propionispora sp. 2/2-37]|uniref:divergent PAP2 family protein n=1 Tax=Propionispora sp. 2/2-37 TaxID=1677858 RepID=UPI0006BB86D5|nr:divergent PAP2 family protein [Propionispora sp. 2/2-37]CUH94291.1 putative membrane protein [Propionispora sp. 2/2-37]
MSEFITSLKQNNILISAFSAWMSAQILKVLFSFIKHREFNAERLIGAGGMPSSHTALVVCLASSVGFQEGFDSSLFAISVILAAIVMYDAAGVRNAAGKQAKVINRLVHQMRVQHTLPDIKLKELLGHTPLEVLAGALLGFFVAYAFYL